MSFGFAFLPKNAVYPTPPISPRVCAPAPNTNSDVSKSAISSFDCFCKPLADSYASSAALPPAVPNPLAKIFANL